MSEIDWRQVAIIVGPTIGCAICVGLFLIYPPKNNRKKANVHDEIEEAPNRQREITASVDTMYSLILSGINRHTLPYTRDVVPLRPEARKHSKWFMAELNGRLKLVGLEAEFRYSDDEYPVPYLEIDHYTPQFVEKRVRIPDPELCEF